MFNLSRKVSYFLEIRHPVVDNTWKHQTNIYMNKHVHIYLYSFPWKFPISISVLFRDTISSTWPYLKKTQTNIYIYKHVHTYLFIYLWFYQKSVKCIHRAYIKFHDLVQTKVYVDMSDWMVEMIIPLVCIHLHQLNWRTLWYYATFFSKEKNNVWRLQWNI